MRRMLWRVIICLNFSWRRGGFPHCRELHLGWQRQEHWCRGTASCKEVARCPTKRNLHGLKRGMPNLQSWCTKVAKCPSYCAMVSIEQRKSLRDCFRKYRLSLTDGAKCRAYKFVMHYVNRAYYIADLEYSWNNNGKDRTYKSNPEKMLLHWNNITASERFLKAIDTTRTCPHLKAGKQHSRGTYMPNLMLDTGQGRWSMSESIPGTMCGDSLAGWWKCSGPWSRRTSPTTSLTRADFMGYPDGPLLLKLAKIKELYKLSKFIWSKAGTVLALLCLSPINYDTEKD